MTTLELDREELISLYFGLNALEVVQGIPTTKQDKETIQNIVKLRGRVTKELGIGEW